MTILRQKCCIECGCPRDLHMMQDRTLNVQFAACSRHIEGARTGIYGDHGMGGDHINLILCSDVVSGPFSSTEDELYMERRSEPTIHAEVAEIARIVAANVAAGVLV